MYISAENQLQTFSNTPANRRPQTTRTALKATKLQYSFHGVFKSGKRLIHQVCQLLLVRSIEESQSLVQLVWH